MARRRAERRRLAGVVPPTVFTGSWEPATASSATLAAGGTLRGSGSAAGRVRGRVRIVRPETIDDLQPGEILVAEVTDVGYTAAFCYAAAVVTELGGPMSHAAVVAREFGFPCVVDVHGRHAPAPAGRAHRGGRQQRGDPPANGDHEDSSTRCPHSPRRPPRLLVCATVSSRRS